jgi:hypothetical protein
LERVCDRIEQIFRDAARSCADLDALADAYKTFLDEDNTELLTVMLHGFAASSDPAIGEVMRKRYGHIYRLVRELTGASPEQACQFLAKGMLLTVMGAMKVTGLDAIPTPWAQEMLASFTSS